jgi:hypothetical protein
MSDLGLESPPQPDLIATTKRRKSSPAEDERVAIAQPAPHLPVDITALIEH